MRRSTSILVAAAAATVGVVAVGSSVSARSESPVGSGRIERVVTLGDSYSSGSGIHRNASSYDDHGPAAHSFDPSTRLGSSACQRELDETPGPRLAAQLDAASVFIACAGAVIREIPAQLRAADIPGDGGGTLVTMTIGGNDLRTVRDENWPDALTRCITSAHCHESSKNQMANLDQIREDLVDTYQAIGQRYPDISVRVLAYPRLMQGNGRCDGVTGISGDEADWIDEQVDLLNHQIEVATARARGLTGADIRFVDVTDEFDNHGACRFWQRDRFVNDAVFGDSFRRSQLADGTVQEHWTDGPLNVSTASFHPSSKGYDAYLGALRSSLPAGVLPTR
ncbi:MAG: SGNH/GDSL hydrolase family protein [Acidobacteriota bacterium]